MKPKIPRFKIYNRGGKSFEEIFDHHILDSVAAFIVYRSLNLEQPNYYYDIGSGAGLPGIVWHICFKEDVKTVLVEPRIKRINFLKEVRNTLSLKNLELKESRFMELEDIAAISHLTLRALKPDDKMLKPIFENSPKNRVIWLAAERSENSYLNNALETSNHSYTIRLKEQYKRTLINFRKKIL
jgi:16S rRNA (guanine527-N7)-methyltransferase